MPGLISGSTLRKGGSGEFIKLASAQPQLPPTPSTSTGFTLVTNDKLQTSYRSSLGNIEMHLGEMYSNLPDQNIKIIGTGTSTVIVAGGVANTSTSTGALLVEGGIGIRDGLHTGEDIYVNGLRIGTGFEGKNNIVVRGVAVPQPDDNATGQGSIAIGYDALQGLQTSYANIAIGRLALSSGTGLVNSIAIGDQALKLIGVYPYIYRSTITNITLANPVVITSPFHNLDTGTYITLTGINGTIELNDNEYYVDWLTTSTFALYTDININDSLDGTGFTAYVDGGSVNINTVDDNNIAIGADSALKLINGRENLFIGHKLAKNLTTGSYNILLGHDVANNLTNGSGNISIGGDNLVDGLNDQVNIGSLLYYNGGGYTQLNSDLGAGLGTWATATYFITNITNVEQTNPVRVHFTDTFAVATGTYVILRNVGGMPEITTQTYYASYETATSILLYYDYDFTLPLDGTVLNTYTGGGEILALEPYGALSVLGGVGIAGNLIVSHDLDVYGDVVFHKTVVQTVSSATIAANLAGGNTGSIPYQTATDQTVMLPIGPINHLLYSDGFTPSWVPVSSVSSGGTATNVLINSTVSDTVYYLALDEVIGDASPLSSDVGLTFVTTASNTSSYFVTGTSVLNVPGSIYSMEGNPDENNLVYSPRTFNQSTTPVGARVGDVWLDSSTAAVYQYIADGSNKIWVELI